MVLSNLFKARKTYKHRPIIAGCYNDFAYFVAMTKFTTALYLTSFLLLISCYQPERNCTDFRTGTYTFDYVVNGEEKHGTFTRDSLYSVEYYDNKIDSAKVKWINECEFVLQDIKTKTSVQMKILSTTEKSYTFEYGLVGKSAKSRGTATRTN